MSEKNTTIEAVKKDITVSASTRFTNAVVKEFSTSVGDLELSSTQKRLIKNYFIKLDLSLKMYEQKRLAKANPNVDFPYTWDKINMNRLAQDVVIYTSMGLDAMQKNHVNLIPYKNSVNQNYDITIIEGYVGKELIAKKYGYDFPDDMPIELVYSTDVFKPIKKDLNNKVESYVFEITNCFERGEIIGGFYYKNYFDSPQKNKIEFIPISDILKRVPKYASAEFWGGEKDKWENGKKVGKEKVEGWYKEMCDKTIKRIAYGSISIDSEKIDDNVLRLLEHDEKTNNFISEKTEEKVQVEINTKANAEVIDFEEIPAPIEELKEEKVIDEPKSFEEAGF